MDNEYYKCSNLASVKFGNSITHIGNYAFCDCTGLTSVNIRNCVTIGSNSFSSCSNLTSIEMPNNVQWVGDNAYENCCNLTSVIFPNSVIFIGNDVFKDCDTLSQIQVGNSYTIERIIDYAKKIIIAENYSDKDFPSLEYSDYTKLDTIVCKLATPPTLYDTFSDEQYYNMIVIVPSESLSDYQSADVWKKFWNLYDDAENYTTGINTVTINNNCRKPMAIYDLQGRKQKTPQRGLNILNGKKVMVK